MPVTFPPIHPDDEDFLYAVYAGTREDEEAVSEALSGMPFCYLGMGVEKWFDSNGVRNPFDSIPLTKKKLVSCPRDFSRMFQSGVQSEFRLDSRLKHAGMTVFGKDFS